MAFLLDPVFFILELIGSVAFVADKIFNQVHPLLELEQLT